MRQATRSGGTRFGQAAPGFAADGNLDMVVDTRDGNFWKANGEFRHHFRRPRRWGGRVCEPGRPRPRSSNRAGTGADYPLSGGGWNRAFAAETAAFAHCEDRVKNATFKLETA